MVYKIAVPQAKYKLLNSVRQKDWKSRLVCLSLSLLSLFIIVGSLFVICAWLNILAPSIYFQPSVDKKDNNLLSNQVDLELDSNNQDATIVAWSRRARMYAESKKENENANRDRTTNITLPSAEHSTSKIIVCYYTVPGELNSTGELSPSDIEPHLCSHIIVGFASVVNCTISLGLVSKVLHEVINIKKYQPKLKIMISVGGAGSDGFSSMAKTHANRKTFIKSVLNVFEQYDLDGIDIDWEFPNWLGTNEREQIFFIQLVQQLKKELEKRGLILSVAVAAPSAIVDQSYIVPQLSEHVDFINLMAYDYHYYVWYFPLTGLNAPLYSRSPESGYMSTLNLNYSSMYWLSKGMPQDKIVIGIPTYGHSYSLDNPFNHDVGAPAKGFGQLGNDGFVDYYDTCSFLQKGAEKVFDQDSQTPYAFRSNEWISFDDEVSVMQKAAWIKKHDFRGAMIFSLNSDDWKSNCHSNLTFPLTRIVYNLLSNISLSTSPNA